MLCHQVAGFHSMLLSENASIHSAVGDTGDADWSRCCTPERAYALSHAPIPWLVAAALLFCTLALYLGFFVAPADAQQGEAYRIIFIHVPAAWMSMLIYLLLALCAGAGLVFNQRLPPMAAQALAPTGAMFAFLALWSGSLWAKPIWGAWWVWDTRLISEFVLLFLYSGFIALHAAIDDVPMADKFGAALVLAGIVNVPINVLSVEWWTTLHQGASISPSSPPGMATSMLAGTLLMAAGCFVYSCAVVLLRLRCVILERERDSDWVATRGDASP